MFSTAKPFVVVEEKSRWYSLGLRVAYWPNNDQAFGEGDDISVYGAKSITFSFVRYCPEADRLPSFSRYRTRLPATRGVPANKPSCSSLMRQN
jgi:hypothetical protein